MQSRILAIIFLALLALIGCGGSSGQNPSNAPPPTVLLGPGSYNGSWARLVDTEGLARFGTASITVNDAYEISGTVFDNRLGNGTVTGTIVSGTTRLTMVYLVDGTPMASSFTGKITQTRTGHFEGILRENLGDIEVNVRFSFDVAAST